MACKLNDQELCKVSGGSVASEMVRKAKEEQQKKTTVTVNNNSQGGNCTLIDNGNDNLSNTNNGIIHGSQNIGTVDIS